jgi:hypothetical protein
LPFQWLSLYLYHIFRLVHVLTYISQRAQKDTAQEVINAVDSRAGELSVDWSTIGQWRPVHNSITSAMPKPNKLATMRGSDGHYYIGIWSVHH